MDIIADLSCFSEQASFIYDRAIRDYHIYNNIDSPVENPYSRTGIEYMLYEKCWIDTVQWHVEDEVRNPHIDPVDGLAYKRKIDALNQKRTDKVEQIDQHFLSFFRAVKPMPAARINTESPAWALDRLSVLALKIYHMKQEAEVRDAGDAHATKCRHKLAVLQEQRKDLAHSINELLVDISRGLKYMKVYRQMKMYNDPDLNPVLYSAIKTT